VSADQLGRAAEVAQRRAEATYRLDEASDAVAALLAAANPPGSPRLIDHWAWRTGCRVYAQRGVFVDGPCPACLLDDVAAAYLGEEPQP
jgi:hypothetical protein